MVSPLALFALNGGKITSLTKGYDGRWFFLDTTALTEVDGGLSCEDHETLGQSASLDRHIAILAQRIKQQEGNRLVLFVHGYSNTRDSVLDRLKRAQDAIANKPKIEENAIWLGYRWPSEQSFLGPASTLIKGLTTLAAVIVVAGLLATAFSIHKQSPAFTTLWWGIFAAGFMLVFLRASAYFRDNYRASNYGVLDLVEFFRRLDLALERAGSDVHLSIIGHSMGAFVATNAVRILTNVFDADSIQEVKEASLQKPTVQSRDSINRSQRAYKALQFSPILKTAPVIGHRLYMERLVLVSPDIPALAIVTGRANFLEPTVRRCKEAYLFSNGGDVILSLISQGANYIQFPAGKSIYAARLGNVQLKVKCPGVWEASGGIDAHLRIGASSLECFDEACAAYVGSRNYTVAKCFAFVDCTAFLKNGKLLLSNSKGRRPIGFFKQMLGFAQYPFGLDCHSGYFLDADLCSLIFGTAAIGIAETTLGLSTGFQESTTPDIDVSSWVVSHGLRICPP